LSHNGLQCPTTMIVMHLHIGNGLV